VGSPRLPVNAYPLAWPPGVPRTVAPLRSPFHEGKGDRKRLSTAYGELRRQLKLLGAVTPVISSDIPLKADGTPYMDEGGGQRAVAVYWHMREQRGGATVMVPYSMPCDTFHRIADNMYAVAKTIEAMRAITRYGAAQTAQVFAGFAALPPGEGEAAPVVPPKPWREVLGGAWPDGLDAGELLVLAKSRYRRGADEAHPDRGGDAERMADLNRAWEEAQAELGAS
jgi:hypothetical protein